MSKEKETGKEKGRIRQLARYYIPYKGLFFTDMFFAMLGAAITLVIPLIVRYITSTVVEKPLEQATGEIIRLGILMIAMVLVEMYCNFYIAYYGHVMGARIEHDMRNEIFGHYQKLSFAFFDNQKVGHLLSRITSDLFDISELLHHGPENIVISFIKLIGAMIILFVVNPMLACVPLVVIVVMLLFALLIGLGVGLLPYSFIFAALIMFSFVASITTYLTYPAIEARVMRREEGHAAGELYQTLPQQEQPEVQLRSAGLDELRFEDDETEENAEN